MTMKVVKFFLRTTSNVPKNFSFFPAEMVGVRLNNYNHDMVQPKMKVLWPLNNVQLFG